MFFDMIMCFFLSTLCSQVVLWRIHKSNVCKLGPSVIEVSDRGGREKRCRDLFRISLTCVQSALRNFLVDHFIWLSVVCSIQLTTMPNLCLLICLGQMMKKNAIAKVIFLVELI